jgi:hypothetical protein
LEFEKAFTWVCAKVYRKSSILWPSPSHSGNRIGVYVSFVRPNLFFRYGPKLVRSECENYTGGSVIVVSDSILSFFRPDLLRRTFTLGFHRLYGQ